MSTEREKPIVLVVEDDPDQALVFQIALGMEGFEVRLASSCADARRELERGDVAAVVTDWNLGDGNALDVVAGAACPSIVLSGLELDEQRQEFDACFLKPAAPARVASTIRGLRYHREARGLRSRAC